MLTAVVVAMTVLCLFGFIVTSLEREDRGGPNPP